ncbi:unnamed protein product [Adineta steineri]|uniref:Putative auto-transporter adhesin head GIN domain-containing protein n=1 Tax=Adineta steineri TaxID=433720 RepID=A0A814TZL4_9BILA|nr:unnamed protein product [Adineta steineri]CAF1393287.1 unnamed protein product [Adineta steineri]
MTSIGDGRISQVRQVSSFHGIKTSGIFKVILTMNKTKPESVILIGDQLKSLVKIETSVYLGILSVQVTGGSSSSSSTRHRHVSNSTHSRSTSTQLGSSETEVLINAHRLISLKTSSMESVEISGAGINADIFELECRGFNSIYGTVHVKQLKAIIDGFSKAHLMGTANILTVTVGGSSKLHGLDLSTRIANVTIREDGYAEISCNQTITVNISDDDGEGTVKYKGTATVIRAPKSTGGTIQKID